VSNAGDVNNDQVDDIVIGDIFGNNNLEEVGSVFIFLGVNGEGLQSGPLASEFDANWFADDPDFDDSSDFAYAVSTAGDVNGDEIDDIIVGAPNANGGSGAAYVYLGPLNGQNFGATRFSFFGFQDNGFYGYSVSTAGDMDADGDSEIIIGSPNYDTTPNRPSALNGSGVGPGAGLAEIYAGDPLATSGLNFLTSVEGDLANGLFGSSVDTAGDVNGDGFSDVIMGAPTYAGNSGSGRAFAFYGTGAIMSLTAENDGPTDLGDETLLTAVHTSPYSGFNNYLWDFGDGTFGAGQYTTHTYTVPGVYSATVSVTNPFSFNTETAVTLVTIQEALYVDPTNGGSTTFEDGSGNTTQVNVPPGAVDEVINIEFIPLDPSTFTSNRGINLAGGSGQPLPDDNTNIFFDLNAGQPDQTYLPLILNNSSITSASTQSVGIEGSASSVSGGTCDPDHFCFNEPVVLVLGYRDEDLNGQNENSLILVVWDENINQWVDATSTCDVPSGYTYDPANNTFSLEICHISRFGVVGAN
ncbi:MAG: PKD domain-containing protein, partial [Chloroflexota bacterium]